MTAIARCAIAPPLLLLLLILHDRATSLIIPEELPTILSLIYSNIPPIKKGTDSRLGMGFRLGEHADFQILIELGPQTETNPLGTGDAKRRRDAMFGAAMRGELGPFAQTVAKYQMERNIKQEMQRLTALEQKLKKIQTEDKRKNDKDTISSDWLTRWKQDMSKSPKDNVPLNSTQDENDERVKLRIGKPPVKVAAENDRLEDVTELHKPQTVDNKKESIT